MHLLPHGYCFLWQPGLLWLHVISDGLIALAYFSIPILLAIMLRGRHHTPYVGTFAMFGLFITFCGATHVIDIVNIWIPMYWAAGYLKAGTALVSLGTVATLVAVLPKLIKLPSPNIDVLTGLPNRILFIDRLEMALARMSREDDARLALLFIDLDGFKGVNDAFGHDCGDEVLVTVASRLSRVLRAVDTVARFGGDEFVVLLERTGDAQYVEQIAREIVSEIERPFALADVTAHISASVGVILFDIACEPTELIAAADAAMYRAKTKGYGTCEIDDRTRPSSQAPPHAVTA